MLEAIRKRSGGIVVKVLLLFLVLSFGAWGIGDYIRGGVIGNSVASVGEKDISPQAFSNEMQREMNRLRSFLGDTLDADMAREIGLPNQVLSRMVRSALYLVAADEFGVVIDDDIVTAEIQAIPAFAGLTGQFDKIAFRQAISNAGFSEQEFIRLIRDDLKRASMINSFDGGAIGSQFMAELIHSYRGETRSVEFSVIRDAQFNDIPAPGESEIAAFHNDNQNQFMAPEYRSLSYIMLAASDFASVAAVSEQEILDAYDMRQAEFVSKGRRQVLQAIYSDEAIAIQAQDMITKGRDFAETAAELTGTSAEALELGWVTREDMLGDEIADAVFATSAGDISAPVKSMLGWHVFKVLDVEEEAMQALDDVRDGLAEDVALEKAIDTLYEQANALEDELGSGATLEEAAQVLGLVMRKIDAVDRSGLDRNGMMLMELPTDDLIAQAFATQEGTESPLIESNGSSYFIVRVDGIDSPVLRPLDTVRDKVANAILKLERSNKAREAAEQAVERLNGSTTLASAIAPQGGDVVVSVVDSFKRDGSGAPADMPSELASVMFTKNIGEGGMVRGTDGYVVAHLRSMSKVDSSADKDAVEQVRMELAQGMRTDIFEQLARALEQRIPVKIYDNVVQQAF